METQNKGHEQLEGRVNVRGRRWLMQLLAIMLLTAFSGVLHAQNSPVPPPAPQATSPSEAPPEPPEPGELPEPPDAAQVFVLNDGAVHLGVTLGDVSAEKAQSLKLPAVAGALVNSVQKGSAAAKAGIETGDAIIEFDGVRVRSSAEMRRLISETPAGRTVEMKIVRDGKTRVLSAKLEAGTHRYDYRFRVPDIKIPNMDFSDGPFVIGMHRITLGISGDDVSPQLAQYFGVRQGKGVLISEVTKGGAADQAGLKAGDVIVQVDGKAIGGVEELRHALNDGFTGDTRMVNLTIVRDHHEQTISATLTHSQTLEKRTSNAGATGSGDDLAELSAHMKELQATAEGQRDLLKSEVAKQQLHLQGEWQRQLQEQMRTLKDQLKQLPNLSAVLRQGGEI